MVLVRRARSPPTWMCATCGISAGISCCVFLSGHIWSVRPVARGAPDSPPASFSVRPAMSSLPQTARQRATQRTYTAGLIRQCLCGGALFLKLVALRGADRRCVRNGGKTHSNPSSMDACRCLYYTRAYEMPAGCVRRAGVEWAQDCATMCDYVPWPCRPCEPCERAVTLKRAWNAHHHDCSSLKQPVAPVCPTPAPSTNALL